jgi:hypothetical protein
VQLSVDGLRVNTYRGLTVPQARAQATATGLGDVALRSKVRLTPVGPGAAAAAVELRLPTGRDDDLLGAGRTALRLSGLASREIGRTSIHGSFAYGLGGVSRALEYAGAIAVAAAPRITLVGELLLTRLSAVRQIAPVFEPHPRVPGVSTTRLHPSGKVHTSAVAAAGIKWNVADTWLLHANVLIPANDAGLTADVTPTVALDYSFAR